MKKYKILFLDVDGTLLDFKKTERYALAHTFQKFAIDFNDEIRARYSKINHGLWEAYERGEIEKATIFSTRFTRLFDEMGFEADGMEVEKEYQYQLAHTWFYMEDCMEVLERLHQKYRLYIVTNGVSSTQHTKLALSGIDVLVDGIFISEEIGVQKPKKEFFDYCASHVPDYEKDAVLIVGDSLTSDIRGGNLAGIDTCYLHVEETTGEKEQDCRQGEFRITYEISSLKELAELLDA